MFDVFWLFIHKMSCWTLRIWDFYKSNNSIGPCAIVGQQHEPERLHRRSFYSRVFFGHFLELESQPGVLLDGLFGVNLMVIEVIWLLVYKMSRQVDKDYINHFILGLRVLSLASIRVGRSTWVYFLSSFWAKFDGDWNFSDCWSTRWVAKPQRLHRSFYPGILSLAIFGVGSSTCGSSWLSL